MNRLKNFIIIAETKESYDKLENVRDYLCVKRKEYLSYYKGPIWRVLKKYLIKNNNSFKEFDVQQFDGRIHKEVMIKVNDKDLKPLSNSFVYYDGKLIKLLVDEKNKVIKKYVLYRGVVSQEYAEINKKFITEVFNIQDGQDSYFRINNYMEFEVNNELLNKRVSEYFEGDIMEINGSEEVGTIDDFISIKIDSPRVKNILKQREDLKIDLNVYSKLPVNIDMKIKKNEISNLEVNIIDI